MEQLTLVLITYQSRRNNLHWHRYICSHSQHWIIGILQMFHQCTDPCLFPIKGLLPISLHAFCTWIRKMHFKAHDLLRGICTQVPRVSQLPTSLQISFRSLLLLVPSAMNGRAPTLLFILSYIFRFHRLNTFRAYPTRKSSMFFKASSMCSPTTDIWLPR